MVGNILLTLAFAAGVFSVVMYYLTYKGYQNTLPLARIGYHAAAILVMAASALLLHAILTHQFEYKYVYDYSGTGMPTGLLMSTFYAGQEGSFMLWTLFSAIIGLILLDYTSKRGDLEPRVMMIFGLAVTFLLMMVSPLLKSPFNYIWSQPDFIDMKNVNSAFLSLPGIQNFVFSDPQSKKQFIQVSKELYSTLLANNVTMSQFIIQGKGLNPLLQNFWMQIHPPMLFIGFSMSAVPFAFALAALIKNEYKDWVKQALPWVLSGTMVLGLAIMLGGYWAYGVLGWGGYWGWDPVENSSLVPWLVGVASIHTLLVQRKTQEKQICKNKFDPMHNDVRLGSLQYISNTQRNSRRCIGSLFCRSRNDCLFVPCNFPKHVCFNRHRYDNLPLEISNRTFFIRRKRFVARTSIVHRIGCFNCFCNNCFGWNQLAYFRANCRN